MLAPCPVCLPLQIGQAGCAGDISVPHQSLSLCAPAAGSDIPCARTPPGTASPTTPSPVSHWNGRELPRHLLPQWEKPLFIHPESPESPSPAPEPALGHRGTLSRARRDFTPKLMQPISSLCLQDNQSSGTGSTRLLNPQIPPLHTFSGSPQPSLPMLGARQCPGRASALWFEQIWYNTSLSCSRARKGWAEYPGHLQPFWRWQELGQGGRWHLAWAGSTGPSVSPPCIVPRGRAGPSSLQPPWLWPTVQAKWLQGFKCCPSWWSPSSSNGSSAKGRVSCQHCLPTSVTSAGTSLEQSSPELRASPQGPGGAHMGSPEQGEGSLPQQPHLERIL